MFKLNIRTITLFIIGRISYSWALAYASKGQYMSNDWLTERMRETHHHD